MYIGTMNIGIQEKNQQSFVYSKRLKIKYSKASVNENDGTKILKKDVKPKLVLLI